MSLGGVRHSGRVVVVCVTGDHWEQTDCPDVECWYSWGGSPHLHCTSPAQRRVERSYRPQSDYRHRSRARSRSLGPATGEGRGRRAERRGTCWFLVSS